MRPERFVSLMVTGSGGWRFLRDSGVSGVFFSHEVSEAGFGNSGTFWGKMVFGNGSIKNPDYRFWGGGGGLGSVGRWWEFSRDGCVHRKDTNLPLSLGTDTNILSFPVPFLVPSTTQRNAYFHPLSVFFFIFVFFFKISSPPPVPPSLSFFSGIYLWLGDMICCEGGLFWGFDWIG